MTQENEEKKESSLVSWKKEVGKGDYVHVVFWPEIYYTSLLLIDYKTLTDHPRIFRGASEICYSRGDGSLSLENSSPVLTRSVTILECLVSGEGLALSAGLRYLFPSALPPQEKQVLCLPELEAPFRRESQILTRIRSTQ
ncbi:hypothetical protein AFLA_007366 [Aspergillus flavus NRRL3357]|nr:hypothetical protein AFLA_007366 [Aspergillus flavus NRRL3357]